MMILHFAPNLKENAFLHNWEIWGEILIFENIDIVGVRLYR